MDRRLTPANARAAHDCLRGVVAAPLFTPGAPARLTAPLTDLCRSPGSARERQVLWGDSFTVIDRHEGWAFGFATKDGYCGYLPEAALGEPRTATHWVAAPSSQLYPEPRLQARETAVLPFGARTVVLGEEGRFSETPEGWIPSVHLRAIGDWLPDPVDAAQLFLGTPYLWGGNSRAGLDCSGLVQGSLLACGRDCPGDADLQEALGTAVADGAALRRGDLLFWKGHVAMAIDAQTMIHATANAMAVVIEDISAAIARIAAQGHGGVTARRRL